MTLLFTNIKKRYNAVSQKKYGDKMCLGVSNMISGIDLHSAHQLQSLVLFIRPAAFSVFLPPRPYKGFTQVVLQTKLDPKKEKISGCHQMVDWGA